MLNPIEFNGMVQRTQDVSGIQQNENIRPQVEHIVVQNQENQKAIIKHEQVNEKDNADKQQGKFDAKEKGNATYYESRTKRKKQNKEDASADGSVRKMNTDVFDVKV
jgi:hypothetical protein